MGVLACFGADGDFVPLCFQRPCEGYVGAGEGAYGDLGAGHQAACHGSGVLDRRRGRDVVWRHRFPSRHNRR